MTKSPCVDWIVIIIHLLKSQVSHPLTVLCLQNFTEISLIGW